MLNAQGYSETPIPKNDKQRVDYIDLMKGLTILWIIWIHTDHPDFGNFRNPIFFFVSGVFFKLSDARTFFTKRIWTMIVPFCIFYLLSIPFMYVVDFMDHKSFTHFNWNRLLDVFKIEARSGYLSLNVPLWFLLTLLFIQTYSFIIFRLPKYIIAVISLIALIFFDWLNSLPSPFMINNALAWFGYFSIGYLCGKPLIKYLNNSTKKVIVFIGALITVLGCIWLQTFEISDTYALAEKLKQIAFIICFMTFFSFFNGIKKLEILRFFGKNSLIVLGAHLWILLPLGRISFYLTRIHSPWIGFVLSFITALLLIPLINWMNKNIPYLVGKKYEREPSTNNLKFSM